MHIYLDFISFSCFPSLVANLFIITRKHIFTHHFTILKHKQEGNGLNALSEALEDVWMLQHSENNNQTKRIKKNLINKARKKGTKKEAVQLYFMFLNVI